MVALRRDDGEGLAVDVKRPAHVSKRYPFTCVSCDRYQTRRVGTGNYATCKYCGTPNPGPAMVSALVAAHARRTDKHNGATKGATEPAAAPNASRTVIGGKAANQGRQRAHSGGGQKEKPPTKPAVTPAATAGTKPKDNAPKPGRIQARQGLGGLIGGALYGGAS